MQRDSAELAGGEGHRQQRIGAISQGAAARENMEDYGAGL